MQKEKIIPTEEFVKQTYLTNNGKFCKPKSESRRNILKKQVHYKKKDVSFDKVLTFMMDKVFNFSIEEQELVKKELNATERNNRRKFANTKQPFQQRNGKNSDRKV